MKKLVLAALATLVLAGCSTTLEPVLKDQPVAGFDLVDPGKVDKAKYAKDFAECAKLANQDQTDVGRMAAGVIGGAAEKSTFGIVGGKQSKHADRVTVLKRCLAGRDYTLLR